MLLYDYIYVDLDKVISLYSQMTGGIVELKERNTEYSRLADNKRKYDFQVFIHDAGGTEVDKKISKETIKPHHALLVELEDALHKNGYLLDLNRDEATKSFRDPEFRKLLKNTFCIKISGRAIIEDYERMNMIADIYPEIIKFISKSNETRVINSPEYHNLKIKLDNISGEFTNNKDRHYRESAKLSIKKLKDQISELYKNATKIKEVDQWILDGMKAWINGFLPGITNLRVYPSIDRPDEHVFGHLKKDCFEDLNTNSFHFTYGSFPTEDLTVVGIITSIPEEKGELFKPLAEFNKNELANDEAVEKAFRGLFRGFDGLEQIIRTCRFPRILIYPLIVYRGIAPNIPNKNN